MMVKELIKALSGMNPDAKVFAITDEQDWEYQEVIDCEQEFSNTVSLGLKKIEENKDA